MDKNGGVTRKAQQNCREQPKTPSLASVTPPGELIQNDNKEKSGWDISCQKHSHRKNRYIAKQWVKMQQQTANIQHRRHLCHPLSRPTERERTGDELYLKACIKHNDRQIDATVYTPPLFSLQRLNHEHAHSQDEELTVTSHVAGSVLSTLFYPSLFQLINPQPSLK